MIKLPVTKQGPLARVHFLLTALAALPASARAEGVCSFDYVAADGLLGSAFKETPRQALAGSPKTIY